MAALTAGGPFAGGRATRRVLIGPRAMSVRPTLTNGWQLLAPRYGDDRAIWRWPATIPPQPGRFSGSCVPYKAYIIACGSFVGCYSHPLEPPPNTADPAPPVRLPRARYLPPESRNQHTIKRRWPHPWPVAMLARTRAAFRHRRWATGSPKRRAMDAILGPTSAPANARRPARADPLRPRGGPPETRGGRLLGRLGGSGGPHSRGVARFTLALPIDCRARQTSLLSTAPRPCRWCPPSPNWLNGGTWRRQPPRSDPQLPYQSALARLGVADDDPASVPALIDLCYARSTTTSAGWS